MLFAFAYYVTSNKVYLGWTSVENILMHGGEIGRRSLDYLINPSRSASASPLIASACITAVTSSKMAVMIGVNSGATNAPLAH